MTRETFATKVAQKLGIYQQNALEAEEQSQILDAYDCIYKQLEDDGLTYWLQTDDVPDRLYLPLSVMVAAECADTFPLPEIKIQRLIGQAKQSKKTISRQLATGQDPGTTEAEYF